MYVGLKGRKGIRRRSIRKAAGRKEDVERMRITEGVKGRERVKDGTSREK